MLRISLGISALVLLALGGCSSEPEWKTFRHAETSFSADFPGSPTVRLEEEQTDLGPVYNYYIELEPEGDRLTYKVFAHRFAPATLQFARFGLTPKILIEATVLRHRSEGGSKIVGDRDITLGTLSGRDITYEYPDGSLELARVFNKDNLLYRASVVTPEADKDRPEVERFLSSFQIDSDDAP